MRSSEATDKIALAFVAAQAALTNPHTDSRANTGKFSYAYLSLPALLEHVKPELQANGLGLMQDPGPDGVVMRLIHTSGQWYEFGPLRLPMGNDMQANGSAITYGRRYQITAALGLAADEDDDGKKASDAATPPPQQRQTAGSDTTQGPRSEPATTSPGVGGGEAPAPGAELHVGCGGFFVEQPGRPRPVCTKCRKAKPRVEA